MAHQYYYHNTKTFDCPGPNQPAGAITTYYKSTVEENDILREYVQGVITEMETDLVNEQDLTLPLYSKPLTGHRKTKAQGGGCYTVADVIIDMRNQIIKKDPTESMFNRWNTAFNEIGLPTATIETVQGKRPAPGKAPHIPNDLFDFGDDA